MDDCDGNMMVTGNGVDPPDFEVTLLEPRPFRPFKSSEEYLYAMKEDLAEWLNGLYEGLYLDADNFLEQMETGVILCQHANNVVRKAREFYRSGGHVLKGNVPIPDRDVFYRPDVLPETFPARDNVSNFISWCRSLRIKECLLFETDDLVLRKNERSFILCLLEVARRGVQVGLPAPLLVQLEQEIDAEMARDDDGYDTLPPAPRQQVVTNDLRSLHERVVELLSRCTCPSQFPMIRVADGKYRIGDTKVLIFVRILRSHVMVRVGGGWDTLEHYLDKHDPCRCRSGHRLATSAKLTMTPGKSSIPSMHVTYNRPSQGPSSTPSSPQNPRRSLSYMSPTPTRRASPPTNGRPLPPLDSPSVLPPDLLRSSSEEEEDESRRFVRDNSSPSSWRYAPAGNVTVAFGTGHQRKPGENGVGSRLPALTPRAENRQPPKVGKVSPRPHYQPNWSEHRSQSSEDLFQAPASGPVQQNKNNLVFHSRGTSPVNTNKGRTNLTSTPPQDHAFRRCDPKRHSSPRINQRGSYTKMQLSPPKFQNVKTTPTPPRRMFWSPERPQRSPLVRKNSAPASPDKQLTSPVLEKLMQHSDLCANKTFLMKIEQLIAEFQAKTKLESSDEYAELQYHSLPVNLGYEGDASHVRKSPVDNGKSPSKIPLPTWYPKCRT